MEQKDFFMALEDAFDETNIEDLTLETNFRGRMEFYHSLVTNSFY